MAERLGVEPLGDEVILSGKDGRGVDVKAGALNERQQQDLVGSTHCGHQCDPHGTFRMVVLVPFAAQGAVENLNPLGP
jgi:hypothetical protein